MKAALQKKASENNKHQMSPDISHTAEHSPSPHISYNHNISLQRKPTCPCGGGCPRCKGVIQPKLKIGQPGDIYEQEADRVAEQVIASKPMEAPHEGKAQVQRKTEKASSAPGASVADNFVRNLGPGQALDPATRAYFEPRFGHDFSRVRVHTDARAAESARAVNARAYTVGRDVVFGEGEYGMRTNGLRLMAHELTHVLQQSVSDEISVDQSNEKRDLAHIATPNADIGFTQVVGRSARNVARTPDSDTSQSPKGGSGNFTAAQKARLALARQNLKPEPPGIVGVLVAEDGRSFEFESGGPGRFYAHIEGMAVKKMNELGILKAYLLVELEPCQTCDRSVYPYNPIKPYEGGPEIPLISSKTGKQLVRQTPMINTTLYRGSTLIVVGPESTGIYWGVKSPPSGQTLSAPPKTLPPASSSAAEPSKPATDQPIKVPAAPPKPAAVSSKVEGSTPGQSEGAEKATQPIPETGSTSVEAASAPAPKSATGEGNPPSKVELLAPGAIATTPEGARETFKAELDMVRKTGQLTDRAIEALWELHPEEVNKLIESSNLPMRVQRQIRSQIPGGPVPVKTRLGAGGMLAFTIFTELSPLIPTKNDDFNANVWPALRDFRWWRLKGVYPSILGVNDRWYPRDNEWTTNDSRIGELLNSGDIDYFALTDIPDAYWDIFELWAAAQLRTFADWDRYIIKSYAVRSKGKYIDQQKWEYRTENIVERWYGHDVVEDWKPNSRLTDILNNAARVVVQNTSQQIEKVAVGPGGYSGPIVSGKGTPISEETFAGKPQAIGRKRFRQNIRHTHLYSLNNTHLAMEAPRDSVFFVFSNSVLEEEVPSGYIVVGGANFNTYIFIYENNRFTEENRKELLLADAEDIEDIK